MKNDLCIIPLRSNSKRLKNKNIRKINDKPLCIYSIKEALKSKLFNQIIIACDSKKYFNLIRKYFKENQKDDVKFLKFYLRSKKSSRPRATTEVVIEEVLKKKKNIEITFLIQATSPLISYKDIIKTKKLMNTKKFDSVFSSFKNKQFIWQNKSTLLSINYDFKKRPMKQKFVNNLFIENGAIYAFKRNGFIKNKNRLFGKIGTVLMPEERSLDIDDKKDFLNAKKMIEGKKSIYK